MTATPSSRSPAAGRRRPSRSIRVSGPAAHRRRGGDRRRAAAAARRRRCATLRHPPTAGCSTTAWSCGSTARRARPARMSWNFNAMAGGRWPMRCLTPWRHSTGCALAEPGEFTRRALDNGRIDLTEAEGLADLLEAETESQRRAALALAEGGLRRQIERWQAHLLGLSARAEAAIDYAEEDERRPVDPLCRRLRRISSRACEWLDAAAHGAAARWRAGRRRGSAQLGKVEPGQCDSRAASGRSSPPSRGPRATISRFRWRSAGCRSC